MKLNICNSIKETDLEENRKNVYTGLNGKAIEIWYIDQEEDVVFDNWTFEAA